MTTGRTRIVAGCMTGTSLDGLDAALVRIRGEGLSMRAELLGHWAQPFEDELRGLLLSLVSGRAHEPVVYMRAARALGNLHAQALGILFAMVPMPRCEFVVAHGQTIWHAPLDGAGELGGGPKSWQLFDPWPVVRRHGMPVCYDLRQADLVAGGEGAPLTPIADCVLYRESADLVINLGGVLNYTAWPADDFTLKQIEGGDLCHCNLLLDGLASRLIGKRFDEDGQVAAAGEMDVVLRQAFVDHFPSALGTLGREDLDGLIDGFLEKHPGHSPSDLLRNAAASIGQSVAMLLEPFGDVRIVLAGGGVRNKALAASIRGAVAESGNRSSIELSDDLGIPSEAREAMGFAVLGALSQDGVPVSLAQVTGAEDPGVAGVWAGV